MSAQVCVSCAKPGTETWPLAFDGRGRLKHNPDAWADACAACDEAMEAEGKGVATEDQLSLLAQGIHGDDWECPHVAKPPEPFPCLETAPGFVKCRHCGQARREGTLLRGEIHHKLRAQPLPSGGRIEVSNMEPYGSDRAFYVRFGALQPDSLDDLPGGTRGVIEDEHYNGGPILVCRPCADRHSDPKAWRPYSGSARASSAPVGVDLIPLDGAWRSIPDIQKLLALGDRATRDQVRAWVADSALEVEERSTGAGGSAKKLYRRPS